MVTSVPSSITDDGGPSNDLYVKRKQFGYGPINKKLVAIWNEEFDVDLIFYSFPNYEHFCLINY